MDQNNTESQIETRAEKNSNVSPADILAAIKKGPIKLNWINTSFLVLSPIIVLVGLPVDIYVSDSLVVLSIGLLIACFLTNMSITAGYHRLFSHKTYEANSLLKLFYLLMGATACQGSAAKWSTDHRRHHQHEDTDLDPYTVKKGFWWAHIGWVFYEDVDGYEKNLARDLMRDPLVAWQHRNYFAITVFMGFILPGILTHLFLDSFWSGILWWGFARVVITQHCTFFINSMCHYWGSKPYDLNNSARDNFVMAFFTNGEGYHNFHHRFQADYRNGIYWYQWDPTKWWIRGFSFFGLTWKLLETSEAKILAAKIESEKAILIARGFAADRVQPMADRIKAAHVKWNELVAAYQLAKRELDEKRAVKMDQIRFEIELARNEWKRAMAEWRIYMRARGVRVRA